VVDFAGLRLTAERLIEANGREVTLTKTDRTAVAPSTPWTGPDVTNTTVTVLAAFFGYEADQKDGSLIQLDDQRCFVADKSVTDASTAGLDLKDFDTLTDGTEVWRIHNVKEIKPSTTRIMYEMQLRK
jgi:hypothetical protein